MAIPTIESLKTDAVTSPPFNGNITAIRASVLRKKPGKSTVKTPPPRGSEQMQREAEQNG